MLIPDPEPKTGAMAVAREMIRRGREGGDSFFTAFGPLNPEAGHQTLRAMLKDYALSNATSAAQVCNWARLGWLDAELAMRELIVELGERDEELSSPLKTLKIELLDPNNTIRHARGRAKSQDFLQDLYISVMVLLLTEEFPLRATRGGRSSKPSACSIVSLAMAAEGLHRGGESAVEKCWKRYKPMIMSGGFQYRPALRGSVTRRPDPAAVSYA